MSSGNLLRALALGAALLPSAAAAEQPGAQLAGTTVVLVHGAFADGSSWAKVIPLLKERGLQVVAVQNPLSSLKADVDAARRAIDQASGPVVLVGHSWGGVVITEAGNDPKVKALVYAAAFAPDAGQSIASLTADLPPPSYAPFLRKDEGGYLTLSEEGVRRDFAQDLPPREAELIAATQGPWASGALDDAVQQAAWHVKPAWTIVTQSDRMIPPALQEKMASTIHSTVVEVRSSHVVMLSHPEAVAETIIAAASAVR